MTARGHLHNFFFRHVLAFHLIYMTFTSIYCQRSIEQKENVKMKLQCSLFGQQGIIQSIFALLLKKSNWNHGDMDIMDIMRTTKVNKRNQVSVPYKDPVTPLKIHYHRHFQLLNTHEKNLHFTARLTIVSSTHPKVPANREKKRQKIIARDWIKLR